MLTCAECARPFPIERGVPRLLLGRELTRTRRGFTAQWRLRSRKAFEPRQTLYGQNVDGLVRWFFDAALGVPAAGDWMLDAGSGSGEKSAAAARQFPRLQVVAMDLADTVADDDGTGALTNLHRVQADVMTPPFRTGAFQHIVSWGVLHHTPNTRAAFAAIRRTLAPDGGLLIWIYPHGSEDSMMRLYYQARDWHFLGLGHRLHPEVRLLMVRLYCLVSMPALVYIYRTKFIPRYRDLPYCVWEGVTLKDIYQSSCFMLYDCLTPEFQFRHRRAEVLNWFLESGLTEVATDDKGHYWGRTPVAAPAPRPTLAVAQAGRNEECR